MIAAYDILNTRAARPPPDNTKMAANLDAQARYFPHTQDQLKEIASDILRHAKALGATDAATEISEGDGLSVSVRRGEVETIEHNRDKMVGVTVT